ncbi:unnamed protein product, partial [Closterium sp. NIES-53]
DRDDVLNRGGLKSASQHPYPLLGEGKALGELVTFERRGGPRRRFSEVAGEWVRSGAIGMQPQQQLPHIHLHATHVHFTLPVLSAYPSLPSLPSLSALPALPALSSLPTFPPLPPLHALTALPPLHALPAYAKASVRDAMSIIISTHISTPIPISLFPQRSPGPMRSASAAATLP